MALRETLARIRSGPQITTVRAVQSRVVLPLLRDLGWDEQDPTQIDLEHREATIVLLIFRNEQASPQNGPLPSPAAYIKIVPLAASLLNEAETVLEATARDGADVCVATNGKVWHLYIPKPTEEPNECQFASWDLDSDPMDQLVSEFRKYLNHQALTDQTAQQAAEHALTEIQSAKRLAETIPGVWRRLQDGPDLFLAEYVQGVVREEVGLTPSIEQVAEVIRSSLSTTDAPVTPPVQPRTRRVPSKRRHPTGYRLWGEHHEVRLQREILTGVAEAIYQRHPDTFERVVELSAYFTTDPSERRTPIPISTSGYYHEGALSYQIMSRIISKLLRAFEYHDNDLSVLYSSPLDWQTKRSPPVKRYRTRRASRRPTGVILWGTRYSIQWQYEALTILATQLYERHADRFDLALQVSQISKDPSTRTVPVQIGSTGYFHEKAVDFGRLRVVCGKLLTIFDYSPEDLEFTYE